MHTGLAHSNTTLKGAGVTCGKGCIRVTHLSPLCCPCWQGLCFGPEAPGVVMWLPGWQNHSRWDRVLHKDGWDVAQLVRGGYWPRSHHVFSKPHPATLPFPQNFYLRKGVCRPLPPSAYTHLWENCWALSTCLVLRPGLVTEEWQGEEQRWKMQHPAFRGLWLHWERQIRNQMKTVSCRDEGLDWVKRGALRAISRCNGRCPAPGRSPLSPTVALGS